MRSRLKSCDIFILKIISTSIFILFGKSFVLIGILVLHVISFYALGDKGIKLLVCTSVSLCMSALYLVNAVVLPAMRHWDTCPSSTSNNFIFSSLKSKSYCPTIKYCVVCNT